MSRNQKRRKARNRNKNTRNKKTYSKSVSFFENLRNNTKNKIKFENIQEKIKIIYLEIIKSIKLNKTGSIFAVSILFICIIGYYSIVHETDEERSKRVFDNNKTVSIDLSQTEDSLKLDLSDEVGEITPKVEDNYLEEAEISNIKEENSNLSTTEKIDDSVVEIQKITADIITSDEVSLAIRRIHENKEYKSVSESIKLGIDMYAIVVENKEMAYLETKLQAENVLDLLEAKYKTENVVEERIIFRETVEIVKVKRDIFDFEGFRNEAEVLEYIIKGTNEQKIHKVVSGENFWVIAHNYGLNPQDLEDANPNIEPKRLQIGTELSLIVAEPIINVVTIVIEERTDSIPYGKEANVKTEKYYVGEYRTKRKGVPGVADLVVEKYSENGKLIGEKILETSIIKDPIDKIVYEGTKPAPPRIGTGTFSKPTSRGYITSPFGPRWGSFHNGMDIGIPSGTEVHAADGGVVIYSGWKGSYGKLIIINHGANLKTYYAHNSSLVVGAGEKIFKGQLIAYSGNTGRSTGPHLHFEVRKNDHPVDPKKYVRY